MEIKDNSERIEGCRQITQISEYLKNQGLNPVVDSKTTLVVTYDERTYWVDVYEDDEQYYSIVAPNFWKIDNVLSLLNAYKACSIVSLKSKVAKAYVNAESDDVWIRVSTYHDTIDEFNSVVLRYLKAAKFARQNFIETMEELENDSTSGPEFTEEDIEDLEELECVTMEAVANDMTVVAKTRCFYSRLKDEFTEFEHEGFLNLEGIDKLTLRTKIDEETVDAYLLDGESGPVVKLSPF